MNEKNMMQIEYEEFYALVKSDAERTILINALRAGIPADQILRMLGEETISSGVIVNGIHVTPTVSLTTPLGMVETPEKPRIDRGKIMALKAAGWTPKKIADEMRLEPKQVSNIIYQEQKKAGDANGSD